MISRSEIDTVAEREGIHTSDVQRDYVHGWLLSAMYSRSSLAGLLTLKGGNCLRKGYFEDTRYSRDLDFSASQRLDLADVGRELNQLCGYLHDTAGLQFQTERTQVSDKRVADGDKQISEARLYFKDFYGNESSITLGIRLDLTQFDRLYLPVQSRQLIHPYSDYEACTTAIQCVKLEEVLATKMRCLLQRRHVADLFDLAYAVFRHPSEDIDKAELLSTFFKVTIFERHPGVAKGLFIDLPQEIFRRLWEKYITCSARMVFAFDDAIEAFMRFINGIIPAQSVHDQSPVLFPSRLRNPIMEAADGLTMLKVTYDGVPRLVEPYSLVFKIRKDGVAREYFYVYDTTGGWNSGAGLKSFVPGKTESIENTDEKFEPRYEVELRKAGGSELINRFKGNHSIRYFSRPSSTPYQLECPYCNKRFRRKTADTKLNSHKNEYGVRCPGRRGYHV